MRCTNIVLLSGLLSLAQANEVRFYDSDTGCAGSYSGCFNLAINTCCAGSATGVKWMAVYKGPYDFGSLYSGGGCTTQFCRAGAAGGFCCGPGVLTGGSWTSKPRRIKRDDDNIDIDIDTQSAGNCTEVNAFGYSSHAGGAWEIRAEDRKDSFARLHKEYQSVASHEKTTWLQSHAAVYKAQRYDGPLTVFLGGGDHV